MQEDKKKKSGKVAVYLTVLFAVAFLLLLMSYFASQRTHADALDSLADSHAQATAGAIESLEVLQQENEVLRSAAKEHDGEVAALEGEIAALKEEIAALETRQENSERAVKILLALEKAVATKSNGSFTAALSQAAIMGDDFQASLTESQLTHWNDLISEMGKIEE